MKITHMLAACAFICVGPATAQDTASDQLDKLYSQTMLLSVQAENAQLRQQIGQAEGRTTALPQAHDSDAPAAPEILGTFSQAGETYATVQSASGRVQLVRVGTQVPGEPWKLVQDDRGGLRLTRARGAAHGR